MKPQPTPFGLPAVGPVLSVVTLFTSEALVRGSGTKGRPPNQGEGSSFVKFGSVSWGPTRVTYPTNLDTGVSLVATN